MSVRGWLHARLGRTVARIAGRLLLAAPTALAASLVVFLVMRALPGDVALTILSGSPHTVEMREALRAELGLRDPLAVQYARWLRLMVNGQFGGRSLESREPIGSLLARQLPVTALLAFYAALLSVVLAVPLGIAAAVHRDRWPDYLIRLATLAGLSVPGVWAALMLIAGLLLVFHWSPPVIYASLRADPGEHFQMMAWPALLLAWEYSSHLVRVTRASMLDVLSRDFVVAARAKGLPYRHVLLRHGLRCALVPVVTMVGLQFGTLLSGALVLETIFGLPGLGRGLVTAALARDYPVVQSFVTLLVLFSLVVNVVVDFLYGILDPRTTRGRGGD